MISYVQAVENNRRHPVKQVQALRRRPEVDMKRSLARKKAPTGCEGYCWVRAEALKLKGDRSHIYRSSVLSKADQMTNHRLPLSPRPQDANPLTE